MNKTLSVLMGVSLSLSLHYSTEVNAAKGGNHKNTPATNGVCDEVKDATKGLYGLCVAYCEAQERPTELSGDPSTWGLKPASASILKNYNKKMKDGDPQMPCVNYGSACPAFSQEDLDQLGTFFSGSVVEKYEVENSTALSENYDDPGVEYNSYTVHIVKHSDEEYHGQLYIAYQKQPWEDHDTVYTILGSSSLTSDEAEACKTMVRNHQEWDTAIDHSPK